MRDINELLDRIQKETEKYVKEVCNNNDSIVTNNSNNTIITINNSYNSNNVTTIINNNITEVRKKTVEPRNQRHYSTKRTIKNEDWYDELFKSLL